MSLVKRKGGGGKRGGGGLTFAAGFRLLHVDVFQASRRPDVVVLGFCGGGA